MSSFCHLLLFCVIIFCHILLFCVIILSSTLILCHHFVSSTLILCHHFLSSTLIAGRSFSITLKFYIEHFRCCINHKDLKIFPITTNRILKNTFYIAMNSFGPKFFYVKIIISVTSLGPFCILVLFVPCMIGIVFNVP